jgi:hypothetical protein
MASLTIKLMKNKPVDDTNRFLKKHMHLRNRTTFVPEKNCSACAFVFCAWLNKCHCSRTCKVRFLNWIYLNTLRKSKYEIDDTCNMIYRTWYMVYVSVIWNMLHGDNKLDGTWYMIFGQWYMVNGITYLLYGIWYMVHGICYVVYSI